VEPKITIPRSSESWATTPQYLYVIIK